MSQDYHTTGADAGKPANRQAAIAKAQAGTGKDKPSKAAVDAGYGGRAAAAKAETSK